MAASLPHAGRGLPAGAAAMMMVGGRGTFGMDVELSRRWDGGRPPGGAGGRAMVAIRHERLELSWNLRLAAPLAVPEGPRGFLDGLWHHDVVELFLAPQAAEAPYLEIELAASGHWFARTFSAPRAPVADLADLSPLVFSDASASSWRGRGEIPLAGVVAQVGRPPWRGLVAAALSEPPTVEGQRPRIHLCWPALPGPRADFHQPARWAPLVP